MKKFTALLPTIFAATTGVATVYSSSIQSFWGAHPTFTSALGVAFAAFANFAPQPHKTDN